jgi:hypothetical protein
MAANNIARLGVVLGLDSAEFVKGLDAANKKLYDFGVKVAEQGKTAVLAMGAAFVTATGTAMKFADEIADVAKANDVAIDTIIKLNNALANSGGNAEDAGKLLAGFTKYIDNAATGSFEAQKALGKLGVSLKDVANLSTEDLFKKIVQSIANIEDPLTRNARAMEIFGKAAKGVDFLGVAEEMDKVSSTTAQQAQAIQDAADAYDLLNQAARDVKFTMTTEIGTSIKQTTEYFLDLFSTINTGGGLWKTVFDKMAYGVSFMAFEVKDLIRVMGAWGDAFVAISQGRFGDLDKISQARMKAREADEAKLFYLGEKLDSTTLQRDSNMPTVRRPGQASSGGGGRTVIKGVDTKAEEARRKEHEEWKRFSAEQVKYIDDLIAKETAAANEDIKRLDERNAALKRNAQEEIDIVTARVEASDAESAALATIESAQLDARKNQELKQKFQQNDLERAQQMFKLEQAGLTMRSEDLQMQKELLSLQNKHTDALDEISRNTLLDANARQSAIEKENSLYEESIKFVKERNRILKDGSVIDGFSQAMDKFVNNLPMQLQRGEQMFTSFTDTLGQAIDQFVEKGTVAWDKLIEGMIKGMIKAELQRQASQLFSMGIKFLFSSFSASPGAGKGAYLPFADGGDPPVNKASMVGERGPELFIPKTAGTIIPNHQLAAMGGGQTINYNGPYIASMSAIDTQSSVQFLAKNKQAVWATYQSANRSIPISR